ncbi:MAG: SDR family oxidoreductase [Nocardioides sp.]
MRIAVAGGTGVVGRHVVREAEARGHEVVVLSRSSGTDLTTGDGLVDALAGVQAVVDVVSTRTQRRQAARAFFGGVTSNLLAAGSDAGVGHHVVLSIVGIDRVPSGYYEGKLLQEELTAAGTVPWSILRCTQFHEFAEQALGFVAVGPFSFVPRMTTQPIAAREVAAALVDLAEQGPQGRVPDLAGPEQRELVDLSRLVNDQRRLGRRVVGVRLPGAGGRGMRSGALTPASPGPRGTRTFETWLADDARD